MKARYYYEIHITVKPELHAKLKQFKDICAISNYKVSDFLMMGPTATSARTGIPKMFCSARETEYAVAVQSVLGMVSMLQRDGFEVTRYKIEDVILDSNRDDYLKVLS